MNNKNIVFVLNEYNGHGGAQRVASILAEEFQKDGHRIEIFSINEQEGVGSYFSEDIPVKVLHDDGYRAGVPKEISSNAKSFQVKNVVKELKRRQELIRRRKDAESYFEKFGDEEVFVIMIQVWGMQWLQPLLYKKNIHIIGQSHESYSASRKSKRYKRILKYYRQVSKFLLLTQKDTEAFKADGFLNTDYIYNPTSFRKQVDYDVLYENKSIVSFGRLVDDKGFDVLIEAFSLIADELPGWKVHIYGEGPARESLEDLITILGLENQVKLMGASNNIQQVLSESSFFVLSSKAEGLPMSLIEAQSTGLPCVSTDCAPGIREIISDYKNGYITPVGDVHLLSRHMKRLAKNPEILKAFSQHAYSNSEKFDRETIKLQWYDLFEELGGYKNGNN